jgi:predicted NBD/HSP70 family sugar kinase
MGGRRATGRLPRGRSPILLRLSNARVIIGVDIRPAEITLVLSDVNGKFFSQEVLPMSPDPQEAVRELIRSIQQEWWP